MAIKDLLVAFDGNEPSHRAVELAAQMADKYEASITGMHVYRQQTYESHVSRWIPEAVLANMREAEATAEGAIEAAFRDRIATTGFKGKAEWIARPGEPDVVLPRYVRYFDMLIAGQFSNVGLSAGGSLSAEELLVRSGKPMIAVPKTYEARPLTGKAAVAWDGSRSAARALTDAMQILETKTQLDVIRLIGSDDDEARRVLPEHDLIAHLKAHGIKSNLVQLKASKAVAGRTILDHCEKTQPDVLVMGAYGRGRFGTLLFGSTAQYVLENMTVPVLMSH